nr:MAG TPA: hypothetical protein [Caudoviricetes sp.]
MQWLQGLQLLTFIYLCIFMHDPVSVLVIMYIVYSTYNCIYIYNG